MSVTIEALGIDQLTIRERLDLIEQIWDSLPEHVNPEEIPEWHLAELVKRRAEAEAAPRAGKPWREALARFREGLMSLPVILRHEADDDIQTTHDELEKVQVGLGDRFVIRVREVLERIESMPEMYGLVWHDVRAARLKKFRHLIYYVAFADRVEVIAVMHGARGYSSWQSRA